MNVIFNTLAAAVCGALSGYGIGGGTLLLVYMTTLAAIPQNTAQGINLLYFIPASLAALYFHVKNGLVDKHAFIPAATAGLISASVTAWAANSVDPDSLRRYFGGFLILTGAYMLLHKRRK